MAKDSDTAKDPLMSTMARALGYLCLGAAELKDAPIAHSAEFLARLGFDRADCARILDTTPETIRVSLAQAKSRNGGARKSDKTGGKKSK
jgi:hypothetical protein